MSIETKKTGFSVIELVVVLAFMASISAIALPRWTSLLPDYALNNSLRQVQSELHHIKMRAAAENVSFQLAYLQDAVSYTIQRNTTALTTKPLAEGTTITKEGSISFSPAAPRAPIGSGCATSMVAASRSWSAPPAGCELARRLTAARTADPWNHKRRVRGCDGFTFNELLVAMNLIAVVVLGYSLSSIGVTGNKRSAAIQPSPFI